LKLGDTFINLNPDSPEHLWIVSSLPASDGSLVIFNLTSHRSRGDETCVVEPGEHPFVKHRSVVAYARGQSLPEHVVKYMQARKLYQPHQPVSDALRNRIQRGALASEFTSQKLQVIVRESMRAQGLTTP